MKTRSILTALGALSIAACTQDNVHMPEAEMLLVNIGARDTIYIGMPEDEPQPVAWQWEGSLTTSVPGMESAFPPSTVLGSLAMTDRTEAPSGYATIVLGQFDITMPGGRSIVMGEMRMEEVQYATYPDGTGTFRKEGFSVMAGQYPTDIYSLSGTWDAAGSVSLTINYKPAAIPMPNLVVVSEFKGALQQQDNEEARP